MNFKKKKALLRVLPVFWSKSAATKFWAQNSAAMMTRFRRQGLHNLLSADN